MDLQERAGGAERREKCVSNCSNTVFVLLFLFVISLKILQMLYSFYVSGTKVFEDDHPLLTDHREKELLLKRSVYQ